MQPSFHKEFYTEFCVCDDERERLPKLIRNLKLDRVVRYSAESTIYLFTFRFSAPTECILRDSQILTVNSDYQAKQHFVPDCAAETQNAFCEVRTKYLCSS